jgi:tripartite-type tricarboxylate transporter receptor subunit TctC
MRFSWKTALYLASFLAGQAVTAPAGLMALHAQPYPSKPIRLIVPFTPGGSNDVVARVVGQKLSEAWKQPVVVENKPGAGGNIGAEAAARSAPDGYTFLIAANNVLAINPSLYDKVPFDPLKDFAPVTLLGTLPILLVVNPAVPPKSVQELIAFGKSSSDGLTYASGGSGTPQHLSAELFKSMTGVKMVHIPYKGNAPAMTDVLSGQVQMLLSPVNSVLPHVKTGRLRALGVASTSRLPYLPEVPTIAEAGVPGYRSDIWLALVAPAGTPKDIIEKMQREVASVLAQADVKEKLAAQGIEPATSSPEEVTELIKDDLARWAKVIKEAGARAE